MKKWFYLTIVIIAISCSCGVRKQSRETIVRSFYISKSAQTILFSTYIWDQTFRMYKYDNKKNVFYLRTISVSNDSIYFINDSTKVKYFSNLMFNNYIKENEFVRLKNKTRLEGEDFEANYRVLSQTIGTDELTGDTAILFKGLFQFRQKNKLKISDTVVLNHFCILPDYDKLEIKRYSYKKNEFSVVQFSYSTEYNHDVYIRYKDYLIYLE